MGQQLDFCLIEILPYKSLTFWLGYEKNNIDRQHWIQNRIKW
jgi:hypothetical protein